MRARAIRALASVAGFALLLSAAPPVHAHEIRPAYLELNETATGQFHVLWKTPMLGDARLALEPRFSGDATAVSPVTTRTPPGAAVQEWTMRAPQLRGQTLGIDGLRSTITDVLACVNFADGTSWTARLTPGQPEVRIPIQESSFAVVRTYVGLGVEHILTGVDHLLFVLALLLVTEGTWKLFKTVSAFTLSHSLTLAAAALGFVHVPQRPVEAVIALSIVFVACEILHARQGRAGITARAPWVVALSFGLLHGLGFAGALSDVGLPQQHIPLALLFFNVGVEIGHSLFVASMLALAELGRRMRWSTSPMAQLVPTYVIGSVAAFWLVQRIAAF